MGSRRGYGLTWMVGAAMVAALSGCPPSALERAYGLHAEGLETGDRETLLAAAAAYEEHVVGCPGVEECQGALARLGDVWMALELYEDAAQAYRRAATVDPSTEMARVAAVGQLEAAERWAGIPPGGRATTRWSDGPPLLDGDAPPGPGDVNEPLTAAETRLVDAADLLLQIDPARADASALRYQAAFLLYQHRLYGEASDRFRALAAADPGSAEARSAFRLLIPTQHARGAWADLVRDGEFFLALDGFALADSERANLVAMVEEAAAR